MVAYSFNKRFAEAIADGRKLQTVRAVGKRKHAVPGQDLQLYTGMRTRQCRKVADRVCSAVSMININFDTPSVIVGFDVYDGSVGLRSFAILDGFASWAEFVEFWQDSHFDGNVPTGIWHGVLIRWRQ